MEPTGKPIVPAGSLANSLARASSQTGNRSSRYSNLKAFKFPDRIDAIRHRFWMAPVHVQLILSDLCNQACHFCAYRDPGYTSSQLFHVNGNYNPNRMLPFEKVQEILEDCAAMGVKAIQLTGGGEPTVYPRFQEVVEEIERRSMKWALVTNGVIQKWDLSSATWIRVSLDAATVGTYSSVRHCAQRHFGLACETIKKYKAGVGFVVTPENWREILMAARLAKDLGASSIRIGAQFSEHGKALFADFARDAAALARNAERLAGDGFEVINRFDEKLSELDQGAPDYKRCGYQRLTTYIGADQNLYRCCVYSYHPRGLLASLKNQRFRDAWPAVHKEFYDFDARGCARCQFTAINRAINEVVDADPSECFV